MVKNWPAMQEMLETWVGSLGRDDPLQEEVATVSSIPAGIGKEERKKRERKKRRKEGKIVFMVKKQ